MEGPPPGAREQGELAVLPRPTPSVHDAYSLGRQLGTGAFGAVRAATHRATGARAACKTVEKGALAARGGPRAAAEVLEEARAMLAVAGHEHVVALRGLYEDEHAVHFVMELCDGGELAQLLGGGGGQLSEPRAAALFGQLARAVAACHRHGVLHRDLKPENVLLVKRPAGGAGGGAGGGGAAPALEYEVRLADFGLAAILERGGTVREDCGSRLYQAPEVLRGRPYDCKADMWSLGCVLFALLAGRPPFEECDRTRLLRLMRRRTAKEDLLFAGAPWPSISGPAKALVRRMLALDPRDRASADEVLADPWLRRHSSAPPPPPAAARGLCGCGLPRALPPAGDAREAKGLAAVACHLESSHRPQHPPRSNPQPQVPSSLPGSSSRVAPLPSRLQIWGPTPDQGVSPAEAAAVDPPGATLRMGDGCPVGERKSGTTSKVPRRSLLTSCCGGPPRVLS